MDNEERRKARTSTRKLNGDSEKDDVSGIKMMMLILVLLGIIIIFLQ